MPKLVKLYIRSVAIGFAVAATFVAMLLWFDVMHLWQLVNSSPSGVLAVFLLWFMNGIVFAGVQFGWAVMAMSEPRDGGRGGSPVVQDLTPLRVRAEQPRKLSDPRGR